MSAALRKGVLSAPQRERNSASVAISRSAATQAARSSRGTTRPAHRRASTGRRRRRTVRSDPRRRPGARPASSGSGRTRAERGRRARSAWRACAWGLLRGKGRGDGRRARQQRGDGPPDRERSPSFVPRSAGPCALRRRVELTAARSHRPGAAEAEAECAAACQGVLEPGVDAEATSIFPRAARKRLARRGERALSFNG